MFHVDSKRLPLLKDEVKSLRREYLFIGIDDYFRELYAEIYGDKSQFSSATFLQNDVLSRIPYTTIKYANGYNPDVWVSTGRYSHKGFKASAGFPTTGFYKAKFNVIGSGSWFELSGNASASLGQNCTVTYNTQTKPTTPVKLYLDYKVSGGSDCTQVDTYTISVPKKMGDRQGSHGIW